MWKAKTILLYVLSCVITTKGYVQQMAPASRSEYVKSSLTSSQKQDMLDAHNKFRSMVQPQAANMEYQVII